ncbi:hypothetical protein ABVK25_008057 [Lepraria finkii]|uniref:Uncharacterized protein n=1 Tax=Lepraria finkii TaxID=1340010 RepID=A0ABR4B167_9LECA
MANKYDPPAYPPPAYPPPAHQDAGPYQEGTPQGGYYGQQSQPQPYYNQGGGYPQQGYSQQGYPQQGYPLSRACITSSNHRRGITPMIEGMVVIGQERRVGFVRRLRRAWLVVVVWIFACFRLGRGKGGKRRTDGGGGGKRTGDGNWHKRSRE